MEELFLSHLVNILHRVSDVRQMEIHRAEPLECEPSTSDIQITIAKLKRHESPSIDQIPAELIQAKEEISSSEVNKLINFMLNKDELP
jgi:hypothetical protein